MHGWSFQLARWLPAGLAPLHSLCLSAPTKLIHFIGGSAGKRVAEGLEALGVAHSIVPIAGMTRTATTLLARDPAAVYPETELIEPSPEVTSAEAAEYVSAVVTAARAASLHATAAAEDAETARQTGQRPALAIMGTCPAGAVDGLYALCLNAASKLLTSTNSSASASTGRQAPLILLDGYRGVDDALDTGWVAILKINYAELSSLLTAAAPGAVNLPATLSGWATTQSASALSALLERWRIRVLAVTDGGRPAFLVASVGDSYVAAWTFVLPTDIAVVNAIGCGDAVAAGMLAVLAAEDWNAGDNTRAAAEAAARAFAYGLAVATAAAQTAHPDDFELTAVGRWASAIQGEKLL